MMNRVELLLRYGVTPVLIFDGDAMPMKQGTDTDRKARRVQALDEGRRLLEMGAVDEAHRMLEKSLDVTTEVAYTVLQVMKDRGIECIVAPYEADAQLGYLIKEGYIHAVVSEDSDLIVYHCGTLLAKMDSNGSCDCLYVRDLPNIPLLSQLSYESFVVGCIMSGCDYLPSLPSIGIKTAFKLVSASKSIPLLMESLRTQHGFSQRELVPYEEAVHKAFYCFAHHLVYDPVRKRVVPFRPFPLAVQHQEDLIGSMWDDELAVSVCRDCTVDPILKKPYTRHHQANVDMFMHRVKGGQASLTMFKGFEEKRAAKIVLGMAAAASSSSTARRLADSPGMQRAPATDSLLGFVGGHALGGRSSDGAAPLAPREVNRQLIVSKYFHKRSAVISDSEESDGEESQMPMLTSGEFAQSKPCDATEDDSTQCSAAAPSATHMDSSPPYATTDQQCPPVRPTDVVPLESTTSPPAHTPPCESQPGNRGCPYGYSQCGKAHSIFLKCFEGKDWSKVADSQEPESRKRDRAAADASPIEDDGCVTSARGTHQSALRRVLGGTPSAAAAAQSSQSPSVSLPPPLTTAVKIDNMHRLRFVPPKQLLQGSVSSSAGEPAPGASRFNKTAALDAPGVSSSTKTAAAIFEQFAFRR